MPFTSKRLVIPDVLLITPNVYRDERGFFLESYKAAEFAALGIADTFVQDNHSKSAKNVVRGIHYQVPPKAQSKLVRCCRGSIFDVCVDIRKNSPTYGRWVGAELSEENSLMMYIPVGFAHGFAALTDGAEIIYKCSAEYSRDHDRGILWSDPSIDIRWPIAKPVLSPKDTKNPLLRDADNPFE